MTFGGTEKAVAEMLELLPPRSFVRQYVMSAAECTDAHLVFHVATALSLLSQTVPESMLAGNPLNLYTAIVGPSGDRKTTAVDIAGRVGKEAGLTSIMEVEPGSQEAFTDSFEENPQQLILYPEFGDFLDQTSTRSKRYLSGLRSAFMKAFDGLGVSRRTVIRHDREGNVVGGGTRGATGTYRVGLLGAVALPLLIEHTTRTDWTGGFLSRFFVVYQPRKERDYARKKSPPEILAIMRPSVEWLARRTTANCLVLPPQPQGLYTPEAARLMDEWYYAMPAKKERNDALKAAANRLQPLAETIARLLCWDVSDFASAGMPWQIEHDVVQVAIRIAEEIHFASFKRIEHLFCDDREQMVTNMVLAAIEQADADGIGLTLGELGNEIRRPIRQIQQGLSDLKVRGKIMERSRQDRPGMECVLANGIAMTGADPRPDAKVISLFGQNAGGSNRASAAEVAAAPAMAVGASAASLFATPAASLFSHVPPMPDVPLRPEDEWS